MLSVSGHRRLGISTHTLAQGAGGITFRNKMAVHPYTPGTDGLDVWDAWYGGTTDFVTVFISHANWSAWAISIANVVSAYAGDARPKIWTVPLCVTGTTLPEAAAGNFDGYYLDAAEAIFADAPASGPIICRVGHEFNLAGTYPWEVINSGHWAEYVTAFRRFVNVCRSVSSRFRFIWNPNWLTLPDPATTDLSPAYPGNAYVDIIGSDLYYNEDDAADPNVAFQFARDVANCGLAWQASFAASKGKRLALCEFGLHDDKPMWIDYVYQWVRSNNYAYVGYWDHAEGDPPDYLITDGSKPDCTRRFLATFRDGGPSPIRHHTFTFDNENFSASGTASFSIVDGVPQVTNVSNYSDRAQRGWLTGLTIGRQYRVELDINTGGKNGRAMVIENNSPFTILGGIILNTGSDWQNTSFTFTATQEQVSFRVLPYAGDAAQVVKFDNVMLFEI